MADFNDTLKYFSHYNFGVPTAVYGACERHSSRAFRWGGGEEDCEPLL